MPKIILQKAKNIWAETIGTDDAYYAAILDGLASVYNNVKERGEDAEDLYRKSFKN